LSHFEAELMKFERKTVKKATENFGVPFAKAAAI
jgi:hypothetical protein